MSVQDGEFYSAVRTWLAARHDPRLARFADGSEQVRDLAAASADFCRHMALVTYREHGCRLEGMPSQPVSTERYDSARALADEIVQLLRARTTDDIIAGVALKLATAAFWLTMARDPAAPDPVSV
jgi:hypothetical protein